MDLDVIRKDLLAACEQVRPGDTADAVDGEGAAAPSFVALPAATAEAAAVMRVAAAHELAVVARGTGSRLRWGSPAVRGDLVIDMSRMSGVVEHSHGDLVARVQAGARMKDVQAAVGHAGQEIALDVPGDASVGGVVASGLAGPRRLRYGTPRDLLIGITIVRADGTVAKSGGKVVKNVAGYDLGKLFAGSAGTLGLISEATFRLHPLPAARAYITAQYVAVSVACDAVAAAANSPLVSSAVELSRPDPGGPVQVGVLLEGSADGVAARAARMAGLLGQGEVTAAAPPWWPGAPQASPGQTLIRVSFWVSALARVLDAIEESSIATGARPVTQGSAGAGVLHLSLSGQHSGQNQLGGQNQPGDQSGPEAVAEFVAALRAAVAGPRGAVVVLAAPGPVRAALAARGGMNGTMNGTVPGLALMRAVKDQFDPGHRMSPGRFPDEA